MKLGLVAGYSPAEMSVPMDVILEAENLGFDSVWTSEAWGSDAVTPAAWILAGHRASTWARPSSRWGRGPPPAPQ